VALTLSASPVQYLPVAQSVRGHVSNFENTFKIYELAVDPERGSEMLIDITPCNGKVRVFVSDDYEKIFEDSKVVGSFDSRLGRLSSQVNVRGLKRLYVGLESANELFDSLKTQLDSSFEIKATYLSRKSPVYTFAGRGDVQVLFKRHGGEVVVKWPQVLEDGAPVSSDRVRYQVLAGKEAGSALYMNAACAVEQSGGRVFGVYMSQQDESDREVRLQRADLSSIQALGLIATVTDPAQGTVTIAYEPYVITAPDRVYGVRAKHWQLALLAGALLMVMGGLVWLACRFKNKRPIQYYQEGDLSTTR